MIAVDVEATGIDAERASIVSIGAVDLDDPANQFYEECRAWDGAHLSNEALAITGFSKDEIGEESGKQTEGELVRNFITWAMDRPQTHTFVGQNPRFDSDFIAAACRRAGTEFPFAYRSIDTHTLCWNHIVQRGEQPPVANKRSAINLDYILQYCGVPAEPKPHNALNGALSHAEVFFRLVYTKKVLPEFLEHDIPWIKTQ
ncbi:MAG: polymerase subunit epsilon [Candidatus Parcubacteria bacterium]|jgi:DNA polymerase III epsilon subunit-like protein|nr:polymerase subunit epsilon [Candidatus Parcubacteria bacterium]